MRRTLASSSNLEHTFKRAEQVHRELDLRLRELRKRAYLTPNEQREVVDLKKRRLAAKDRMRDAVPDIFD